MSKHKDIVISIFEEYIKLKLGKHDKKILGRHKGRRKQKGKKR